MKQIKHIWITFALALAFAFLLTPGAAAAQVTVRTCAISRSDHNSVEVSASGASAVAGTDGSYYLFALMPYETKISRASYLAGTSAQRGSVTFRVRLNRGTSDSLLYRKFVVAVKKEKSSSYSIVSNALYITNPEVLAKYTYAFPKAASKKGLHVQADMLSDAEDLRIKHAVVNVCLDTFIAGSASKNASASYSYTYQGKRYWFVKSACQEVDRQTKKLSESGVLVSAVLLLRDNGAGSVLAPPKARGSGRPYYGLNTMNKEGVETLAALMSFLGERYSAKNGKNGRIVNWIVGNEVDYYGRYNYMGSLSFASYVEAYARSFRVVSTALHSVYSKARVYISLDHCWNILQPDGQSYRAKRVLDEFAAVLKKQGDIPWNLAFHPYPAPLTDPAFWDDDVSSSDSTKTVTMKNIGYLTDYVSRKFRKDVRILLSEQGFTSGSGKTTQKRQAAAFAYAYYITEFNSKIDAFIMNRHVDHAEETKQGLYLGLWSNKNGKLEYAAKKKEIYDVFRYIDSASSKSVTSFALAYLPGSSWSSLIRGFSFSRFNKMGTIKSGGISAIKKYSNAKTVINSVKYSYNGTVKKSGKTTTITVNTKANPNLYQGAGWTYGRKLNFSARSRFTCRIRITGMKEQYAHVRIRFFSGKNLYEASARVRGGGVRQLAVNLSKWKYRKSVDKIQIWVRPYKAKGWKKGAKITVSYLKQVKKVK